MYSGKHIPKPNENVQLLPQLYIYCSDALSTDDWERTRLVYLTLNHYFKGGYCTYNQIKGWLYEDIELECQTSVQVYIPRQVLVISCSSKTMVIDR